MILRISRTLGCFDPGHFALDGSPYPIHEALYPPAWDRPSAKSAPCGVKANLFAIWVFATGSVLAVHADCGVKAGPAAFFLWLLGVIGPHLPAVSLCFAIPATLFAVVCLAKSEASHLVGLKRIGSCWVASLPRSRGQRQKHA